MNTPYNNNTFRPRRPLYEDPIKAAIVANEQIRYPEVRLIDANGTAVGVMQTKQALKMAKDQGLDLIEVTAEAKPPVVKIVDMNKHIYNLKRAKKETEKKARENATVVKEIQLRPVTDKHDLDIKINQAKKFLSESIKVRVVIKFKGREMNFTDKGYNIMNSFLEGLGDCRVEKSPSMEGKAISAIIAPLSKNQ